MAILADYLVIAAPNFLLEMGRKGSKTGEKTFKFSLPSGVQFDANHPMLLHYQVGLVTSRDTDNQVRLQVSINNENLAPERFITGHIPSMVEAALIYSGFRNAIKLTGQNTIRFKIDEQAPSRIGRLRGDSLSFRTVVLLFQRDSNAAD